MEAVMGGDGRWITAGEEEIEKLLKDLLTFGTFPYLTSYCFPFYLLIYPLTSLKSLCNLSPE